MVDMIPVQSSNIEGYAWDDQTGILTVWFLSGSQYESQISIPENVIDEVFKGGSVGSNYHRLIKNSYPMVKVI